MYYYFLENFSLSGDMISFQKSKLQIVRNSVTDQLMQLFILSEFDWFEEMC